MTEATAVEAVKATAESDHADTAGVSLSRGFTSPFDNIVEFWGSELELRTKFLVILTVCLCINIILIRVAWGVYGKRVQSLLDKPAGGYIQ